MKEPELASGPCRAGQGRPPLLSLSPQLLEEPRPSARWLGHARPQENSTDRSRVHGLSGTCSSLTRELFKEPDATHQGR